MTDNDWVAYCFDEAVIEFGSQLDMALEECSREAKTVSEGQGKQQRVLMKWLNSGDQEQVVTQKFANPVATKRKE